MMVVREQDALAVNIELGVVHRERVRRVLALAANSSGNGRPAQIRKVQKQPRPRGFANNKLRLCGVALLLSVLVLFGRAQILRSGLQELLPLSIRTAGIIKLDWRVEFRWIELGLQH